MNHLSDSYIKSGMKKLVASLPCLEKLYIDAMQCTWNIYCLADIMQWISVAKELRFLTFKMRADQGKVDNFISFEPSAFDFSFSWQSFCAHLKRTRFFFRKTIIHGFDLDFFFQSTGKLCQDKEKSNADLK